MRSSTSFRRTQILLTKLIRLTIETGSVTGTCSTICRLHEINTAYIQLLSLWSPCPSFSCSLTDFLQHTRPAHT